MAGGWRDRRVPEFQAYLRNTLGREPTERDYAAAIMQLEARGPGSVAVGHAFRNRIAADGGDAASHLRHYDPVALGHRWREVTPAAIDKWGAEYDKIASGDGPLRPGQTHFFSPAGMQAYYNKDPSLVRSSVRMNVPGHGEVLVPSWATKAVAAGDFVNVNGQWHLTPNERYGQDVASPAPARDAAPSPVVASSTSSSPPPAPADPTPRVASDTAITSPSPSSAIDAAMRVARGFGSQPQQQETESIIETTSGGMPRPRVQMAEAPIPYMDKVKKPMILTRADGGHVDPPAGGAGRFASPVLLTQSDNDTFTRRVLDRLTGVGRLPYANGGSIDDTGANIPETRDALMAQQRQLIEGRRTAQMFPIGTEELPLPPGMERIETSRGVFHFDPMRISARDIEMASIDGRENEILGLGPLSKDDVARLAMETGESPVAITERDRSGNELRASLATPSTVPLQSDEMLRSAAPDNMIDVEPVGAVVEQRGIGPSVIKRASGGGIGSRPIVGPLIGATGGRADKVPGTARSGSHVLPADLVAHMGQGNTNAGLRALEKMFKTGPYGMALGGARRRADGGEVAGGDIPVMLSDGEFVVPPEVVASLGDGDIQTGHDVLDAWIMDERSKHIQTLQALPPPATD